MGEWDEKRARGVGSKDVKKMKEQGRAETISVQRREGVRDRETDSVGETERQRDRACGEREVRERDSRDRDRDRDRVAVLGRHTKSQKQRQKQNRQEVETRGRGRGGDSAGKENRHAGFQAGVTETGKPAVTGKSSASKIAFIAASSAGP